METRQPQVSLGIPVYNGERYIASAIESLLQQTFDDFELIISDNASTDATQSICRGFAERDARIRYERQTQNRGAAWNFNRVLELARGSYFKWAACDDLHDDTFLEKCVGVLDANPSVVWCHSRSVHVDAEGTPMAELADVSYASPPWDASGKGTRESSDPVCRFRSVLLGVGGNLDLYGLIRRDVLARTMSYLPYYGAEKVLIGELALRGRYREIPESLFRFRVHEEASSYMSTLEQQMEFMAPKARSWLACPRLCLFSGHMRAILRSPISLGQRLRCFGVLAAYLFQVKKWKSVLLRTVRGQGTGGAYVVGDRS